MPANLESSAMVRGLEKISFFFFFIPIPKKGNAKECSDYHTIVLISHDSKVILKTELVQKKIGLVQNWERSMSRLYTVILLI